MSKNAAEFPTHKAKTRKRKALRARIENAARIEREKAAPKC
mgnify:CR=1 FL=1